MIEGHNAMPTQRTIRRFPDAEALSRAAAEELVRMARPAMDSRGNFTVALSGGSTPRRLYQLLAAAPYRAQVDWTRVEFFWGDERSVPPSHKDSNYRMAREAILDALDVPAGHVHRMHGESSDLEAAAQSYQAELARVFGVPPTGAPPRFDLVLLGMGPDGHTASLFPHTAALAERVRWVVPNHVPQKNTDRLTLTVPLLNAAAVVLFLVAGEDKTDRLAEVLEGPPATDRLPSQLIRPTDGQLLWFVDEAAARKLKMPA
jgi:6-phosphogluconolactonase